MPSSLVCLYIFPNCTCELYLGLVLNILFAVEIIQIEYSPASQPIISLENTCPFSDPFLNMYANYTDM